MLIDANGYCIFHSEDIEWKRKNNFGFWMQSLFVFLSLVDGSVEYIFQPTIMPQYLFAFSRASASEAASNFTSMFFIFNG